VYNVEYQAIEATRCFEHLGEGESAGIDVYYRERKEYKPNTAVCGEETEEEGKKRVEETNRKKNQGKEPSGAQIANNR
jgi:hypothetical protein